MKNNEITADDYKAFRQHGEHYLRQSKMPEDRIMKLKELHKFVVVQESSAAKALGNALKIGGVGAFYGLKNSLEEKLDAVKSPNVRKIGEHILENAEEVMMRRNSGFGRNMLQHATRLDTLRTQGNKYPGNRLLKRC